QRARCRVWMPRGTRAGHARAVLLARNAALRARWAERPRRRSRLRSGQAAGQRQERTHRAGGLARHHWGAEIPATAGRTTGGERAGGIASRVREPAGEADYASRRATRDEAAV